MEKGEGQKQEGGEGLLGEVGGEGYGREVSPEVSDAPRGPRGAAPGDHVRMLVRHGGPPQRRPAPRGSPRPLSPSQHGLIALGCWICKAVPPKHKNRLYIQVEISRYSAESFFSGAGSFIYGGKTTKKRRIFYRDFLALHAEDAGKSA